MEKFKSVIDRPQKSDYGDGFGHYDAEIEKIEFSYCFMNKDIAIWLW